MSEERIERLEKLEKSLQVMRKRVDEVDRGQRAEVAGLRYAVFACVVALGTVAIFLADTAGRRTHVVFVALALLTAVAILFVGNVEPDGWYDPEDGHAGPGRWLTLLAALALAVTHGSRAGELRDR